MKSIKNKQKLYIHKFVRFVFFVFMYFFVFANSTFGIWQKEVNQYLESLDTNDGFPTNCNDEIQKILIKSNYDKMYLNMKSEDFGFLVSNQDRDKQKVIDINGIVVKSRDEERWFFGKIKKIAPPKVELRKAQMSLRWALSLYCGKPSFKIKNKSEDIEYKLKSFCGAHYGVEEKLFGQVSSNLSSALIHSYHIYNYSPSYSLLFVNGRIYGLYLSVPDLDKWFFLQNGILDVKKSQNCIFKVPVFASENNIKDNITSKLEIINNQKTIIEDGKSKIYTNLSWIYELEYGNDDFCFPKLEQMINIVNEPFEYQKLSQIVNLESVLFWWLIHIFTKNEVSLTHNYLMVLNDDKFNMWFWDTEDFHGCQNIDISSYTPNNRYYNKLFNQTFEYYKKNNPDKIVFFEQIIKENICNQGIYHNFKNTHLKYIFADRFLWNIWNVRKVDIWKVSESKQSLLDDLRSISQKKTDFNNFYKKQYSIFDEYFGFGSWTTE